MAMQQGIDLSRFRKIASDKKVATMRHVAGHEMKIALQGLSPKMRETIDGMPLHLADGTPEAPVTAPDQPAAAEAEAPAPAPVDPTPISNNPAIVNPQGHAQELDQEDARYGADKQAGHIAPKTMHDQLFANKSTLGKIGTIFGLMVGGAGAGLSHQPNALLELMQKEIDRDLDAQKNSASNKQNWYRLHLEHEMQRANINRLNVQNVASAAETALTQGRTGQLPFENKRIEAATKEAVAGVPLKGAETERAKAETEALRLKTKTLGEDLNGPTAAPAAGGAPSAAVAPHPAEVRVLADAGAKNKMAAAAGDHINDMIAKMPPGPARNAAIATAANVVNPGIRAFMMDNNAKAAAVVGGVRAQNAANQPAAAEDTGINQAALDREIARGHAGNMVAGVARGIPPSQEAAAIHSADMVRGNRAVYKMYLDTFNKLNSSVLGDSINPADRKAAVESLSDMMAKNLGLNADRARVQAESIFPGATDWGSTRATKLKAGSDYFRSNESGITAINKSGIVTKFPEPPAMKENKKGSAGGILSSIFGDSKATAATGPKEGDPGTGKTASGETVPTIYSGGKWIRKK